MDICSEKVIENYLLYKNPLYAFRLPIAILLGIFLYGYFELKHISDNSYIRQILIPLACILVILVLLDMLSRIFVSKDEKDRLMKLCKLFMAQPHMRGKEIDIVMIEKYGGQVEGFKSEGGTTQTNQMPTISELPVQDSTQIPDTTVTKKLQIKPGTKNINIDMSNFLEGNNSQEFFTNKQPQIGQSNIENTYASPYDSFSQNYENPDVIPSKNMSGSKCIQNSDCCNLCSGTNENPCNINNTTIPGPQWMPQSAASKQNELKNNQFTPSMCQIY